MNNWWGKLIFRLAFMLLSNYSVIFLSLFFLQTLIHSFLTISKDFRMVDAKKYLTISLCKNRFWFLWVILTKNCLKLLFWLKEKRNILFVIHHFKIKVFDLKERNVIIWMNCYDSITKSIDIFDKFICF